VQYRNKLADRRPAREQAGRLLRCAAVGAKLIVNDDLALALEIDADGVHLGGEDGDLAVPGRAGPGIASSACPATTPGAGACRSRGRGVDTLPSAAMFARHQARRRAGAAGNAWPVPSAEFGLPVAPSAALPWTTQPKLIAAGADLLAVISDVFERTRHPAPARRLTLSGLFN
jgi:thiamine-phosphate pyrophosphorylase